jgi:hypothetical protein
MRIFFDFEFIENGAEHPIIPISVGIVREDSEAYYAEFEEVDWSLANDWVLANVKPHLNGKNQLARRQIADEILEFVGERPEFWGYYAAYDWVLLCSLYGAMVDNPKSWPMICYDIKQYMVHLGVTTEDLSIPNAQEHHALADAHWNHRVFLELIE